MKLSEKVAELVDRGLTLEDVMHAALSQGILPLQARAHPMDVYRAERPNSGASPRILRGQVVARNAFPNVQGKGFRLPQQAIRGWLPCQHTCVRGKHLLDCFRIWSILIFQTDLSPIVAAVSLPVGHRSLSGATARRSSRRRPTMALIRGPHLEIHAQHACQGALGRTRRSRGRR